MIAYGYDKTLESLGTKFIPELPPSKKFSKRIEFDLPKESNDISIALKLYNNLNKEVVFKEEFEALGQDLSIDFIRAIYDTPINEINSGNNEITCNSWSKLYTYFLEKNNIPAVIAGLTHKYVIFKANGYVFIADGTEVNTNNEDNFTMNDLTRARLGLRPCGMNALIKDEELGVKKVNVYELNLQIDDKSYIDNTNFLDRTLSLTEKLQSDTNFQIRNLPTTSNEIIDKFSIINSLLLVEDLDCIAAIEYINNLIKVLFTKEEQKHLVYVYLRSKDKEKYKYMELINFGEERVHKKDYTFGRPNNLDGYNFIYKNGTMEYLTPRKARKMIEESGLIDMEITSRRG